MINSKIKSVLNNQRGDFGIRQIAYTLAVILLIGTAVSLLKAGMLRQWIEQVWNMMITFINNNIR